MSELPKSWVKTGFLNVFDVQGGTQPPKSEFLYEPRNGYVQLLQIRDFGERAVPTYIPDTSKLKKCIESDILIARYGASLGRILTGLNGAYNVAMAKVEIPEQIERRYVFSLLRSEAFQGQLRMISRSAQNGFNKQDLETFEIPLAPLPEQKRIADKLDTVLARVDACRKRLNRVPLILKRFKQSVLAAATSGKLTEDWRAEHMRDFDWSDESLSSIGIVSGGLTKNSKRDTLPQQRPYLRVANVYANLLKLDEIKEIGLTDTEFLKTKLEKDDLLIVEGNGSIDHIGRVAIWNDEIPNCSHQNHIIRWRSGSRAISKYVLLFLLSPEGRKKIVDVASSTTGLHTLSVSKVSALTLSLPEIDEQHEIVRRIEMLFSFADRLDLRLGSVMNAAERLTPALLAKAFRGELVPQDPRDEPAAILLQKIAVNKSGERMKARKQSSEKHLEQK